jgi:hypothetical protein
MQRTANVIGFVEQQNFGTIVCGCNGTWNTSCTSTHND